MAQHGMRMAKPDEKDFKKVHNFLNACDTIWDNKWSLSDCEDAWEDWDDEDEEKILVLSIQKELAEDEGIDLDEVDNKILMYEYLKRKFKQADCSWRRVVWGGEIVIEAACDPTLDYCDFMPGIVFNHVEPEQ